MMNKKNDNVKNIIIFDIDAWETKYIILHGHVLVGNDFYGVKLPGDIFASGLLSQTLNWSRYLLGSYTPTNVINIYFSNFTSYKIYLVVIFC